MTAYKTDQKNRQVAILNIFFLYIFIIDDFAERNNAPLIITNIGTPHLDIQQYITLQQKAIDL
jgi:hypothetical protein